MSRRNKPRTKSLLNATVGQEIGMSVHKPFTNLGSRLIGFKTSVEQSDIESIIALAIEDRPEKAKNVHSIDHFVRFVGDYVAELFASHIAYLRCFDDAALVQEEPGKEVIGSKFTYQFSPSGKGCFVRKHYSDSRWRRDPEYRGFAFPRMLSIQKGNFKELVLLHPKLGKNQKSPGSESMLSAGYNFARDSYDLVSYLRILPFDFFKPHKEKLRQARGRDIGQLLSKGTFVVTSQTVSEFRALADIAQKNYSK